jgi:hypothetical protein
MKKILAGLVLGLATLGIAAQSSTTTTTQATDKSGKALPSPRMLTKATIGTASVEIDFGAPSLRGRELSTLVPAGKIWRAGANEATGLKTSSNLMIGTLHVPAGSYTLFVMPAPDGWWLVVNKQTGQWGLTYKEDQDLGRTKLTTSTLAAAQDQLSISVDNISGSMGELHLKWGTTDAHTSIMAH